MKTTDWPTLYGMLIAAMLFYSAPADAAQPHRTGKGQEHMKHMRGGDLVPCMEAIPEAHRKEAKGPRTGRVVINKPRNGAALTSRSVRVEFDVLDKSPMANHLHIYLDGRCLNMIRGGKSYFVSGLREGKHRIDLRFAGGNRVEYGPSASVEIRVVQRAGGGGPRSGSQKDVVSLRIVNGKLAGGRQTIRVTQGNTVRLRWTTDAAVTVHLHGYDIERSLKPGTPSVVQFKAHAAGRFPVTLHHSGGHSHGKARGHGGKHTTLMYLEVRPR